MATAWLPDCCLFSQRTVQAMSDAVANWAATWFAKSPWLPLGGWDEVPADDSKFPVLLGRSAGFEIRGTGETKKSLGVAMIGVKIGDRHSEMDDRLLRKLAENAISDLETRLLPFGNGAPHGSALSTDANSRRIMSLLIGAPGKAQIVIESGIANIVEMARKSYSPTPCGETLIDPIRSLDRMSVSVAARLGTASISLRDLAGLEPGDVLMLDTKPDDPVDLLIEDRPSAFTFTVAESDNDYILEFQGTK